MCRLPISEVMHRVYEWLDKFFCYRTQKALRKCSENPVVVIALY